MRIPIQACAECNGRMWKLGKYTISGKTEEKYIAVMCSKCCNVLFFAEEQA